MIYLDVLDSVKTAHPKSLSLEWWHPQSEIDQAGAIAIAESSIMMRILMGETISISNNQMIDSVAWLSIAEKMCKLADVIPWAPFKFVYYEPSHPMVTPLSLRKLLLDSFKNEKYEFSAWVNLDKGKKSKIIHNINKENPQYDKMLYGFSLNLDKDLSDKLYEQAEGLRYINEYLIKYERSRNVCIRAGDTGTENLIWPRIQELEKFPINLSHQIIENIYQKVGDANKENRSSIYKVIKELGLSSNELEILQRNIDIFYNEKLSVSVNYGRGEFSMTDHTPDVVTNEEFVEDANADKMHDRNGIIDQTVYNFIDINEGGQHKSHPVLDPLTWNDIVEILKDEPRIIKSAQAYQNMVDQYYTINPESPEYHQNYTTWLGRTFEKLDIHRENLAQALGNKVTNDSTLRRFIVNTRPYITAATAGATGYLVGLLTCNPGIGIAAGAAAGIFSEFSSEALELSASKIIESRSIARYRANLKKAIQIKEDEELRR